MGEFFRRIYYLLNRRKLERDLQHDIEVHREMMPAESRRDFGNATLLCEQSREAWGWSWLDRSLQDLRFGARLLRKSPALAFTAIAVLALGIGVNITAFSVVDVMFFKPLPVRDPHSLVKFSVESPMMSSTDIPYPAAMFYAENNNNALSAVLAQTNTGMTLTGDTNENVRAGLISANYFKELGASASFGRLFDPKIDDLPDSPPVVVLGYRYWQNRFGGDPNIVGQTIRLNKRPATVIGVTAFDFTGLEAEHGDADALWLVISKFSYFVPETKLVTSFDFDDSAVHMSARLKPGVSLKSAEAALQPLSDEVVRQHPDTLPKQLRLIAKPGGYAVNLDPADSGMLPIFGLFATLVLLILATACSNLGNLLLGHAANRAREISIRLALGATRRRMVRQLMTENLLLAWLGSAAGFFLSWNVSRPLALWMGAPANLNLAPDWRIWLFTLGIGTLACVLFGLPPAQQAARQAHCKSRARTIFMSTQIAASCVLLVVSALLVRALYRATNSDPGFDYTHIITIDPQLYAHGYTAQKATNYMQDAQARLEQLPGVLSTAQVAVPPMGNHVRMQRAGRVPGVNVNIHLNDVSPHLFQTLGVPLLRGRDFSQEDKDVAIVSDSCARALWPGKDPLQQVYEFGKKKFPVVGVVGNARLTGLRNGDDAVVYMPLLETEADSTTLLVRIAASSQVPVATIADVAKAMDKALSPNVKLLATTYHDRMADSERFAVVVSGMGGLALSLAIVGLYGVVAYSVSQRIKEIGIRIALGATRLGLVRNMTSSFVMPLSIALAAGLVLAAGLSTILRQTLYGVSNWDPLSYLGAVLLLGATGSLAALIPARRALKVDPMAALRCE